jgi:hypothetical protein
LVFTREAPCKAAGFAIENSWTAGHIERGCGGPADYCLVLSFMRHCLFRVQHILLTGTVGSERVNVRMQVAGF